MTEFGPIQEVKSRFGVSELEEATPVFTLDFGVLCEYGDGVFALLDMAAVSRQRQVTSGLLLDSDYLSVIKHSLRKNLSIAVWKANARSMLDMAKMLSVGEVLEGASGDAVRGSGASLVGDGLEWEFTVLGRGLLDLG